MCVWPYDHITVHADRYFTLSGVHSSGQSLKTQAGLQPTTYTEERAVGGLFLTPRDF